MKFRIVLLATTACIAATVRAEMAYTVLSANLGGPDFVPVRGDFDGDGKQDPGVYQELTGNWYVALSSNSYQVATVTLGGPGFLTAAGDFDGDGRADPAVFQEDTGDWYARLSSAQYSVSWLPNFSFPGFTPVPGDYDGDGIDELAIYQRASGDWHLLRGEEIEVTDTNLLTVMYSNAMVNAANVTADKIRRDLSPITVDNQNLVWRTNPVNGAREVLVASFMRYSVATSYYQVGRETSMRFVEAWVTLSPELKNFCRSYTGTNLALRVKQLLGLPATAGNDTVVEYYADARCLFRPSRDPEVTDRESEIAFRDGTPWLGTVSTNYAGWFARTIQSRNYGMTNGVWNAWPWTQLGYTYDWSKSGANVMGLSEYVFSGPMLYNDFGMTAVSVYVASVSDLASYGGSPDRPVFEPRDGVVNVAYPDDQ